MSSPKPIAFHAGRLAGTKYVFAKEGDTLLRHSHDDNTNHIVIVLQGAADVRDYEGDKIVNSTALGQGNVYDCDAPVDHDIIAREDNTIILNLIK